VFGVGGELFQFGAEDGEVDLVTGAAEVDGGAAAADADADVGEDAESLGGRPA
jgi:hypothetical protein